MIRWLDEIARQSIRRKTYESYALNVRRLVRLIGSVKLENLTPAHIQLAYGSLTAEGLASRSVRQAHVVLHRALRQASQWGMLLRNPADDVSLPRPERREIEVLSEAEVRQLIEGTVDDGMHALWVLLATTGLRLGEALGLRWDDLDMTIGRLTIRRALQRQKGSGLVFVEPKTGKSRRTVYLATGTIRALAEHRQCQAEKHLRKGRLGTMAISSFAPRSADRSKVARSVGGSTRRLTASVYIGSVYTTFVTPPQCMSSRGESIPRSCKSCSATARSH